MRLLDRAAVRVLPVVPRSIVGRVAATYIAGTTLEEAGACVRRLNTEGKLATVDVLGEEVATPAESETIARAYHDVLELIHSRGLDANLSIKPTAFGLKLDRELCRSLLHELVVRCAEHGTFVRIDMEDSSTTDDTLELYRGLRADGLDNVGLVLQAALRRTLRDVTELAPLRPSVRLCKGIYVEAASIGFVEPAAIRESFLAVLDALLATGAYVAVATHDEWLLERALDRLSGMERDAYELQMLLGVREARATELVAAGHRLRVYVPYGVRWYEYALRRLQENPRIAGYVARDLVGRVVPGLSPR